VPPPTLHFVAMGSSCGKACQSTSDESDVANLPLATPVVETDDKLIIGDAAKEEALPVVEAEEKAAPVDEAAPAAAEPSAAKDAEPEVEPKIESEVAAEVAAEASTKAVEGEEAAAKEPEAAEVTEAEQAAAKEAGAKEAEDEAAAKKAAADKKRKAAAAAKKKKELDAKKKAAATKKKAEAELPTNAKEDAAKKEEDARKRAEEEEEKKAADAKKGYKKLDAEEKSETKGQYLLDGKGAIKALDGMIKLAAMQKKYFQGLQAELKGKDTRNALFGPAMEKSSKAVWDLIKPIAEKYGFEEKLWHEVVLHETILELAKEDRNIMTKIKKLGSQLPLSDEKLALLEAKTAA